MPGQSLPGDKDRRPLPSASASDAVAAEIEAEIADHLATAAGELEAAGVASDQARQKAQEQFGDTAAIGRRCYWIKQGDSLMFRTAVVCLLVALCIGLAITTIGSWQAQSRMAAQMDSLTAQLKVLSETKTAEPAVPAERQPLEITGTAYLGSPDTPAAHSRITIIDVKDGTVVRHIATDREGSFKSGPLGGGEYALLAETETKLPGDRRPRYVQSAPIGVYPGIAVAPQRFDMRLHVGGIAVETSRPLPNVAIADRYTIDTRLMVKVYSSQDRAKVWVSAHDLPLTWPVYPKSDQAPDPYPSRSGTLAGASGQRGHEFYELLSNERLDAISHWTSGWRVVPAGKVLVAAAILADVYPAGYERQSIPERSVPGQDESRRRIAAEWQLLRSYRSFQSPESLSILYGRDIDLADDRTFWLTKGLGNIWFYHLQNPEADTQLPRPNLISPKWLSLDPESPITLESGRITRLKVEIPGDLESRIQTLVDSTADPTEFAKATLGDDSPLRTIRERFGEQPAERSAPDTSPFFRAARTTVIGTEPLVEHEAGVIRGDSPQ
jgi:hypothetical protein